MIFNFSNELTLPLSPVWYKSGGVCCAPDNTLIYAGNSINIVLINANDSSKPAKIKVIRTPTSKIIALAINYKTWNNPDQLVASVSNDSVVRLWNIQRESCQQHFDHKNIDSNDKLVAVSIAGERVITVTASGYIIVWQYATNTKNHLPNIFCHAYEITCMSSCPHADWLAAFGTSKGVIVIVDLRRNGRIIHKMYHFNETIVCFSWCPIPINIFKGETKPQIQNVIKTKSVVREPKPDDPSVKIEQLINSEFENSASIMEEITNIQIPRYEAREKSEYQKVDKANPWSNINYSDSDEELTNLNLDSKSKCRNFLEDCNKLMKVISGDDLFSDDDNSINTTPKKTLSVTKTFEDLKIRDTEDKKNCDTEEEKIRDTEEEKDVENSESSSHKNRFISKESDKEYLFAAVSIRGMIIIIRGLTDGRQESKISCFVSKNKKNQMWWSIYWIKPDLLLTSTSFCQLYCIHFNTRHATHKRNFKTRLIHSEHTQLICNIASPFKLYENFETTDNFDDLSELRVWTTGMDRWIICTDLSTNRQTYASYQTVTSFVNYLTTSPIDPTKLAFSLNNSLICVWDLSQNINVHLRFTVTNCKLKEAVTLLDWHPLKENILAFVTSGGQIGEVDITNVHKEPVLYKDVINNTVYRIQWGYFPYKNYFAIYSCAKGVLNVHDSENIKSQMSKIDIDNTRVTTFSWNSDHSIIAVGSKEGHIKLLSKDFLVYETLFGQKKSVQCVEWHLPSTATDESISPFANYLAVSTNESDIFIYKCLTFKEKTSENVSELVAVLKGYGSFVKYLSWNSQVGGKLISTSECGIVHVWDVATKTIIATNRCRSYGTTIWNPVNSDLIISMIELGFFQIWNCKNFPPVTPIKEDYIEKAAKSVNSDNEDTESGTIVSSSTIKKPSKQLMLPTLTRMHNRHGLQTCYKLLEQIESNVSSDSDTSDDESEKSSEQNITEKTGIDPVQLFGSRKDALEILKTEETSHLNKNHWDSMLNIGLWRGESKEFIETAVKTGFINPWIIQMAPSVSYEFYSELCLKYANKLAEDGEGLLASNYYLLCHEILKAIHALCNSHLYKEALILAKTRLPGKNPVINEIYEKWIRYATHVGNYEEASQILIKVGKFSEAAELLNKRSNQNALELAAKLAEKSNNRDLLFAIKTKIKSLKQVQGNENCSIIHISESRVSAVLENKINIAQENSEIN